MTVVAPKTFERKTNVRWPKKLCLMLPQLLRSNGLHWRQYGEFVAGLTSADDKLKLDVDTTRKAQLKTVQPRTKPAILLMLMLLCPAPYFANALLCVVFIRFCCKILIHILKQCTQMSRL